MHSIFRYTVEFFDEYEGVEKTEKGIVTAENYAEAVRLLTDPETGYGELFSVKVSDLDDRVITDSDLAITLKRQ